VVPFGLDDEQPVAARSPLRESGAVSEADRLALWAGGMWSWLDPITAIRAMGRLRATRPDLKLAFVGLEHPDPLQRAAHAPLVAEAHRCVRESGLEDTVLLRPEWLSRAEYVDHVGEADVGISLHRPTLESRFATRARLLDYLAAGLPVLCSAGDTMSELVAANDLGAVVRPSDVDGCAAALDLLTTPGRGPVDARAALEPLRWRNVARPLIEFCADPGPPRAPSAARAIAVTARSYPAFLNAVYRSGPLELVRGAARQASRTARRR
jgi:glycosyltransferase involved in cell wall biosynthesis